MLIHARQRAQLDQLLEHIAVKGPVKSSDFARTSSEGGGWWGWKDEKRWLETLFASGELMVARQENFHRVYDLSERVAPQVLALEANGEAPDGAQVHARFIERSIAALGITQAPWVNDYFRIKPRLKDADLDALVTQGIVQRILVEGWAVGYVANISSRRAPPIGQVQSLGPCARFRSLGEPNSLYLSLDFDNLNMAMVGS